MNTKTSKLTKGDIINNVISNHIKNNIAKEDALWEKLDWYIWDYRNLTRCLKTIILRDLARDKIKGCIAKVINELLDEYERVETVIVELLALQKEISEIEP